MTNQTPKMLWYLQVCIQTLIIVIAVFFNLHMDIWEKDATKLSFFIVLIWAVTTALIGFWHFLASPQLIRNQAKIGWYLAETCLAVGMVGTVAGFLMMLGTAFSNIDVSNVSSLQQALAGMAVGMSTALYTTLVGLIASIFLKSQLVNLEHLADGLE
jgi:hypothetical protein